LVVFFLVNPGTSSVVEGHSEVWVQANGLVTIPHRLVKLLRVNPGGGSVIKSQGEFWFQANGLVKIADCLVILFLVKPGCALVKIILGVSHRRLASAGQG